MAASATPRMMSSALSCAESSGARDVFLFPLRGQHPSSHHTHIPFQYPRTVLRKLILYCPVNSFLQPNVITPTATQTVSSTIKLTIVDVISGLLILDYIWSHRWHRLWSLHGGPRLRSPTCLPSPAVAVAVVLSALQITISQSTAYKEASCGLIGFDIGCGFAWFPCWTRRMICRFLKEKLVAFS